MGSGWVGEECTSSMSVEEMVVGTAGAVLGLGLGFCGAGSVFGFVGAT